MAKVKQSRSSHGTSSSPKRQATIVSPTCATKFTLTDHYLPLLVVQVEQLVRCVTVCVSICLDVRTVTFELNDLVSFIYPASSYLWPPYVIGGPLYFCPVISFLLSFFYLFFFPRLISAAVDWMSAILLHMAWP